MTILSGDLAPSDSLARSTPMWWDLELWGRQAEVAASYTQKGSIIGISGELKFEYWVDKNTGLPRSKSIVKVTELDLISSPKREETNNYITKQIFNQDIANAKF